MTVSRSLAVMVGLFLIAGLNAGCEGRMISEGLGVVTGASGKVVDIEPPPSLRDYRGFRVVQVSVTHGLETPPNIARLVGENLAKAAADLELTPDGRPCLQITGEITNYETADLVDTAIGPLEECIMRATLSDAGTGRRLATANLVARAKSTSAGGEKNLSAGIGKALTKWLDAGGIKTKEEKEKETKKKTKK